MHGRRTAADSAAGSARPLLIATGLGRLYGMPDLPMNALTVGVDSRGFEFGVQWSRTGSEIWAETRLEAWLGRGGGSGPMLVFDRLGCGTSVVPPAEGMMNRSDLALRLRYRLRPGLRGWIQLDLSDSRPRLRPRPRRRWCQIEFARGALSGALGLWRREGQPPTLALAGHYRLVDGFTAGLCAEPAVSTIGMLFSCAWGGTLLRGSHILHPALGITHRWEVVFGIGSRR